MQSTSAKGASVIATFTGAVHAGTLATVGRYGSGVQIYVDGVFSATARTSSRTTVYRRLVYDYAFTAPGAHTITMVDMAPDRSPAVRPRRGARSRLSLPPEMPAAAI